MKKQKKLNKHLLMMIANLAQRLHKVEEAINRYDTCFDVLQARVTKLENIFGNQPIPCGLIVGGATNVVLNPITPICSCHLKNVVCTCSNTLSNNGAN